jgi:hypothetical protein
MTDVVAMLEKEVEELKAKEAEAKVPEEKPADAPELNAEPAPEPDAPEPDVEEPAEAPPPEGERAPEETPQNLAARNRVANKKKWEQAQSDLERERSEKHELQLRLAKLEALQEANKKPEPAPVIDHEPEYDPFDPKPWMEWNSRQHQKQLDAVKGEFTSFKQTVAQTQAEAAWERMNNDWQNSDEVYANSYKFAQTKLNELLEQKYPTATPAQLKQLAKQEEALFVADKANKGIDVRSAFKLLALENGFNPYEKSANNAPKPVDKTVPNLAAVAEGKKKSGSFIGTPGTGGIAQKGGAQEIAKATLEELMNYKTEDFRRAQKEAKELGERGVRL